MKVTDGMKKHVRGYTEMFLQEVVEKANMSRTDLAVLFFLATTGKKWDWWQLSRKLKTSYGTVMKSLKKLMVLGLVVKQKRKKKDPVYYYDEGEKV